MGAATKSKQKSRFKPEVVSISITQGKINGNLTLLPASRGIILFAHGSGSSRFSPRNRYVAEVLRRMDFRRCCLTF